MSKPESDRKVELSDSIGGTVTILRTGPVSWTVRQRNYGEEHDNNQNPTWLRVHNPGAALKVTIRLIWAESRWMGLRTVGYMERNGSFRAITGQIDTVATTYQFEVPAGDSYFGAFPWYTNEDADRMMQKAHRQSTMCSSRVIGVTAEGRDIRCLTIERPGGARKKENVTVFGRFHATEPSGSFAVDGAAELLLSPRVPEPLFERYAFHLVPVANPDGTENGLKLTKSGPIDEHDLVPGGLSSNDPTIKAIRDEIMSLKPAGFISHHCYLMHTLWLGVFDNALGIKMLDLLVDQDEKGSVSWTVRFTGPEKATLRHYCHTHFNSTAVFTELPWQGRLPKEIKKLAADIFLAAMIAHDEE